MTSVECSHLALRPITIEDRDLLYRVYASTREEELAATGWSEAQKATFLQMQLEAQHRHYTENYEGASLLVIECDGDPAGRLYVARWPNEIRIMDIALLPEYRGKGIGSRLLADILEEGQQRLLPVTIHVERFNPALKLYERLGFRAIEENGVYLLLEWIPDIRNVSNSMKPLSEVMIDDFSTCLGGAFTVELPGGDAVSLELVNALPLSRQTSAGQQSRQPFSLGFLGPPSDFYLPQRTYQLQHAELGSLEIFLVPLGPKDRRMRYEAIFT